MGKKSFRKLTTFGVGGKINHYFEAKSKKKLIPHVLFAKNKNLPIFILGGGSDILVGDRDFEGVVIKYTDKSLKAKDSGEAVYVTAGAGMNWDDLVKWSVKKGLQGMECLSGIPGTVGGSPVQNVGAYGQELSDTFYGLEAFDTKKLKSVEFDRKGCAFSYRESVFKKPPNWQRFVIMSVTFCLKKNAKPGVKYESLADYLKKKGITDPSLKDVREAVLKIRSSKFEDPKKVGNAGSFFKNPVVDEGKFRLLRKKYPGVKFFKSSKGYKIPAGWLIEKAGWKGRTHKSAGVSPNHALVLINPKGKAKAEDVLELSGRIIDSVQKKFGINLQREVQLINFGGKVAILGYGIEGEDAEAYFREKGEQPVILDRKFDENYLAGLDLFDVVVRSPGVYRYLPEIVGAEKKGTKVTSAIRIFFDECPARIIGVTGTKGKGTTSTLVYEILKKAGFDVYLAGNIGKPYLELLGKLNKRSIVVMEMSSFQLIDMEKSPHIAVVLNVTQDHLDWHKDLEEYVRAKKNIARFQKREDFLVINNDYPVPKSFASLGRGKKIYFSLKEETNGCFVSGGEVRTRTDKGAVPIGKTHWLLLRGSHNLENVAAAVSACGVLGVGEEVIKEAVFSFRGLEHRLELVSNVGGVSFYNDSFATGPQPTIAAINSFEEATTLILGGYDKKLDFTPLIDAIAAHKNLECVVLMGNTTEGLQKMLKSSTFKGKVVSMGKSSMEKIVREAFSNTKKGGVVLFSPAAASFDMFANYKERGKKFKQAVAAINGE